MKEKALELGFVYNRRGCSCSGSPFIYLATRNNVRYELTIWTSRDIWQLSANNTNIAEGTAADLTTKIQKLWD